MYQDLEKKIRDQKFEMISKVECNFEKWGEVLNDKIEEHLE